MTLMSIHLWMLCLLSLKKPCLFFSKALSQTAAGLEWLLNKYMQIIDVEDASNKQPIDCFLIVYIQWRIHMRLMQRHNTESFIVCEYSMLLEEIFEFKYSNIC